MFVFTYLLSQLRKMLILLIRSHSKICPLHANNTSTRDLYCWQWTNFIKRYLPNLDVKLKRFVTKIRKKWLPNSIQTDSSLRLPQLIELGELYICRRTVIKLV